MLLAVDIGNSNISIGLFDREEAARRAAEVLAQTHRETFFAHTV